MPQDGEKPSGEAAAIAPVSHRPGRKAGALAGRDGEAGQRRARAFAKGRQVDPKALAELDWLLEDRPKSRDQLIEHLHAIQDHYGHLSARHLAALAHLMRLPMAEVYEVATFYAHFDVVKEGEEAPGLTIRICDSLSCQMNGAEAIIADLQANPPSGRRAVAALLAARRRLVSRLREVGPGPRQFHGDSSLRDALRLLPLRLPLRLPHVPAATRDQPARWLGPRPGRQGRDPRDPNTNLNSNPNPSLTLALTLTL